ncbi:MAG TPA: ABC transporter ATP-binding protein, partial [Microbacterium sp.]|nr:ABC transporter ATP-binding protein [Microbacterium sp.]
LGLDAVARQIFYDRLLEDYTEHPRTVILSSHLIDEVSNLIERVLVIDRGQIIMDAATDDVRNQATAIVGDATAVDAFVAGREVLHRESLGRVASVTVAGALSAEERSRLTAAGLDLGPVSLQQLIVRTTQHADETDAAASDTRTTTKGDRR